jgi:hypothetical protein
MSAASQTRYSILFLDFDGVLQTPSLEGWEEMEHCDGLMAALATVPKLRIVVTSTHREDKSVSDVARMLPPFAAQRVAGVTPVTSLGRARGGRQAEIEAWLRRNSGIAGQYVAVDDEPHLYEPGCPWLVRTRPLVGWDDLTTKHVVERLSP